MLRLRVEARGVSTPVPVPGSKAEVWRDPDGAISAYAEVVGEEYWMHLPGLASFRFASCNDEITAIVDNDVSEELVLDAYRRKVLPMALQVQGREVLHASAICSSAGVTALCGVSETGKSTIAFALSRRGYRLWADDAVTFEVSDDGASTMLLPFKSRLRRASAALFAANASHLLAAEEFGVESDPFETAPLLTICMLRRARESSTTVVRQLSSSEAFTGLLNHACCFTPQDSARKRKMIQHYLEIVAEVPIYDVCFQSGLESLPTVLDSVEKLMQDTAQAKRSPAG